MYRYKLYPYEHRFYRKSHEKVARVEGILQPRFDEEMNLSFMSVEFQCQLMLLQGSYPGRNPGIAYGVIDQGKPKTWCLVCFPKARYMIFTIKSKINKNNTHFHGLLKKYDMGCTILLQTKNFFEGIDLDRYQLLLPMLWWRSILLYSNQPSPET